MSRQIYYEANISCSCDHRSAGIAVPFAGVDPIRTGGVTLKSGKYHNVIPHRPLRSFHKAPKLKKQSGVPREKADALLITGRGARLIISRPLFAISTVRRNSASLTHVSTPGRLRADCRRVQSPLCTVGLGPVFHTTADAGSRNEFFKICEVASLVVSVPHPLFNPTNTRDGIRLYDRTAGRLR